MVSHQLEEAICNVHGIHLLNAYCRITRHLAASLGQKEQRKPSDSLVCNRMTGLSVENERAQDSGQHACLPTHCQHRQEIFDRMKE